MEPCSRASELQSVAVTHIPVRLITQRKYASNTQTFRHSQIPRATSGVLFVILLLTACGHPSVVPPYDPDLLAEIQQIKAFDNHAHPVLYTAAGEKPDRDYDALPVDNLEPSSDALALRPNNPLVKEADRAL
jgi:hypothetical protein